MRLFSALIICVTLFYSIPASSESRHHYGEYEADVIGIIDGDTLKVYVYLWPGLRKLINLRLAGVNTPESRSYSYKVGECEKQLAKKATEFTRLFVNNKSVIVSDIRIGKFAGRVLGRLNVNNLDLGDALIKAGYAKPYFGGKRTPWCND